MKIYLGGGCGKGDFDREEAIKAKLRDEDEREKAATSDSHDLTRELLIELGYQETEIAEWPAIEFDLDGTRHSVSTDFMVSPRGSPFMAIRCSMALDSRERHILSFARCAADSPIPLAIVTDGLMAHVLDSRTGRLIGETLEDIPARDAAMERMSGIESAPIDLKRIERERRVLLAFEVTTCPRVPEDMA